MNSFTTVIYTFKVSEHIIIGQSTNINVFSWLLLFFKLREREWYTKFGFKGKCPQSYLSYFSTGFHWRIFPLSRANRLCSIFLHWLEKPGVPLVSVILLSSTRSKMAMVRLPATNPAQKLTFLQSISADGGGGESPTSVLGSQPIIWLLSPSSWCPTTWVRSPSTNICLSPLWPTFFLNGHFFDGLILSIQIRGVVILSPSSRWDIAWQYTHETLVPFEVISFGCNALVAPWKSSCVSVSRTFVTASFISSIVS